MLKADKSAFRHLHRKFSEPDGKLFYHFNPKKGPKREKPTEAIASNLVGFIKNNDIDKDLQTIEGHFTNLALTETLPNTTMRW